MTQARCDRHVGEAFAPRCADCDRARREATEQEAAERHERAVQRNLALGITPDRTPRAHRARGRYESTRRHRA